ncbi:Zinc finger protein 569 [Plakobranchus ocellatus]|uniref:Zinc finger protein 569 n=1 Tax=Plakobranchus ocellatus TaxID=259542 RepID=A0AAV3YDM7_9GAST|nr:Zinc finger protein 569 [Plakobranchus ocellatus]
MQTQGFKSHQVDLQNSITCGIGGSESGDGNANEPKANIQCNVCGAEMFSLRMYRTHVSLQHPHLLAFTCPVCGKGMQTKSSLTLHMASHGTRKFVCHVCDFKFKLKHHLRDHLLNRHSLFYCLGCSGSFPAGYEADQHVLHCMALKRRKLR